MKKFIIPGIIGLGLLAITILRKKKTAENLRAEIDSIKFDQKKSFATLLSRLYFIVKLKVINNETENIQVKGMTLRINAGEGDQFIPLGEVTNSTGFVIREKSSEIVSIEANVSTLKSIDVIKDLFMKRYVKIFVKGFVDTDLGRVPVEIVQTIDLTK